MVISYNIVIIVPKNTKSDERNNPSFQKLTQENMERIEKKKASAWQDNTFFRSWN